MENRPVFFNVIDYNVEVYQWAFQCIKRYIKAVICGIMGFQQEKSFCGILLWFFTGDYKIHAFCLSKVKKKKIEKRAFHIGAFKFQLSFVTIMCACVPNS